MHRFRLLLAAFACSVFSLPAQSEKPKSALEKSTIEDYVRHLYVWGPQIQVKVGDPTPSKDLPGFKEIVVVASAGQASQDIVFHITPDGKKLVLGNVYDIAKNPFEGDSARIKTDLQPSFGVPGAPVVIAVFSDFQCPYCREEAKMLRDNLPATFAKEVRLYYKDFPLESIHPWAKSASIAGRCVFRQKAAAFWEYHDWIYEHQAETTAANLKEKVMEFARSKGIEPVQLSACIDSRATESDINSSVAEGKLLGVNSTPTLFVNGRKMPGQVSWPQLKQVVEHEIEYQKTHGGGEKCCEVKLPSPLNK